MLPVLVSAPFVAAALVPLVARWRRAPGAVMVVVSLAAFAWLLAQWPALVDGETALWERAWVPGLGWTLALHLDGLSHLFAMLITGIGAAIAWYGIAYLGDDERSARFFGTLLAFQGGMLLAVLADDLVLLFVGWEVTSVASFVLIGFAHDRVEAREAAQNALAVTVAGGLAMLAGLVLLGTQVEAWRFTGFDAGAVASADGTLMAAALLLICLGAFTKSAQFPFHGWLPGAMAAPTPVSAYLHSATMVKLGVYLLARLQPSMGDLALWSALVPAVGAATMLIGAVLAVRETDLKRVLAYSTVSALGSMVLLAGIGTGIASKAFVVTVLAHACYKAALFLVAGTIDHETGTRDRLALAGLRRGMPLLGIAAGVAAVSMAGFPPALGFVAKETLIATAFEDPGPLWVLVIVAAGALTIVAAVAAGIAPFLGRDTRSAEGQAGEHPHEAPLPLWAAPAVLAVLGILLGFVGPGLLSPALAPAVASVYGTPYEVHLAFWEGLNRTLAAGVATIALGLLAARYHRRYPRVPWLPFRSERLTQGALNGLQRFARFLSGRVQHGSLPGYIAAALVLTTVPLAVLGILAGPLEGITVDADAISLASATVVGVGAFAAARSRNRIRSIAAIGATGFGMTLIFLRFGAPDLAMTQALVETLTVILFVFAFRFLPIEPPRPTQFIQTGIIGIAAAAGIGTSAITLLVVRAGHPTHLREFFEGASVPAAQGRNIVNTILVDFRALDTLGEITVLAMAAVGILALLRLAMPAKGENVDQQMSPALRSAARALVPLLLVLSFFLFFRGHDEPGGGFVAGLVAASGVALYAIAYDAAAARSLFGIAPRSLLALGMAIALGAAAFGTWQAPPLTGQWTYVTLPGVEALKVGTPLIFDFGVYLVVLGVASALATALLEER